MGKLQEFLMANEETVQATAEVAVSGFPVPFTIKSITEGENKAIRKLRHPSRAKKIKDFYC